MGKVNRMPVGILSWRCMDRLICWLVIGAARLKAARALGCITSGNRRPVRCHALFNIWSDLDLARFG